MRVLRLFESSVPTSSNGRRGPSREGNHARNRGLQPAKGAYYQFLDGDDLQDNTKLEKQVAFLE